MEIFFFQKPKITFQFLLKLRDLHLSMKNPKFSMKLRMISWLMKIMGTTKILAGQISIRCILRDELELFWVYCRISILLIVLEDNSNYLQMQDKWRWDFSDFVWKRGAMAAIWKIAIFADHINICFLGGGHSCVLLERQ